MRRIKINYVQQMDIETTMTVGDITLDNIIEKLKNGKGSDSFNSYLNVEQNEMVIKKDDFTIDGKLLCLISDVDSGELIYTLNNL